MTKQFSNGACKSAVKSVKRDLKMSVFPFGIVIIMTIKKRKLDMTYPKKNP